MLDFDSTLEAELDHLQHQSLRRSLRKVEATQGSSITLQKRPYLNFSSNDYLGLADHPHIIEAAIRATRDFGTGSRASRLICGTLQLHHALEETLASWKGTQAALTFSSGYATALGTIPALVGKKDTIFLDKHCHACLIDGAKLSGATLRVFPHNRFDYLEQLLQKKVAHPSHCTTPSRLLILTESIFSMEGDGADLTALVTLKEKYGAWLLVDEAHASGLYGPQRRGRLEALGLADQVEIQMGTLGKALGSSGGYVAGSRSLIDYLINRSRSFIYSTAPPPSSVAASLAAIELLQGEEGRQAHDKLWQHIYFFEQQLPAAWKPQRSCLSPIFPLIIGSEKAAISLAQVFHDHHFYAPAIRYPTVPRHQARLRITLSAAHQARDIERLIHLLHQKDKAAV